MEQVPLAEAAKQLGLSVVAARRRAQRGTLESGKIEGEWYVTVPDRPDRYVAHRAAHETDQRNGQSGLPSHDVPVPGPTVSASTDAAVAALERTVQQTLRRADQAEEKAREMAAAAAMWQERARNLEGEVGRLQELLALPAHEEPDPSRRRWWERWRR
jgi:hypothetical protein